MTDRDSKQLTKSLVPLPKPFAAISCSTVNWEDTEDMALCSRRFVASWGIRRGRDILRGWYGSGICSEAACWYKYRTVLSPYLESFECTLCQLKQPMSRYRRSPGPTTAVPKCGLPNSGAPTFCASIFRKPHVRTLTKSSRSTLRMIQIVLYQNTSTSPGRRSQNSAIPHETSPTSLFPAFRLSTF